MKLAANNIKFIDRYLENSGVKYIDVRMEMTDHIATALEEMDGDFYDNFKSYMIANKSLFLNTNRKFIRAAIGTALRTIGQQMVGPWFLLPFSFMLCVLYFIGPTTAEDVEWAQMAYMLCFLLFIVYYVAVKDVKKNLFSAVDKILFSGWLLIYISFHIVIRLKIKDNYKMVVYAFFISLTFAIVTAFYKMISKYKKQYYAEATPQNIG